jgi:adenylate cyclase class IV
LRKQNQRLRIRCEDNTIVITKKTKYEHDYTKSMKEDDITVKSVKYAKKLLEEEL